MGPSAASRAAVTRAPADRPEETIRPGPHPTRQRPCTATARAIVQTVSAQCSTRVMPSSASWDRAPASGPIIWIAVPTTPLWLASDRVRTATRASRRFGSGFSVDNLESMRRFYISYPPSEISETLSRKCRQAEAVRASSVETAGAGESGLFMIPAVHYRYRQDDLKTYAERSGR